MATSSSVSSRYGRSMTPRSHRTLFQLLFSVGHGRTSSPRDSVQKSDQNQMRTPNQAITHMITVTETKTTQIFFSDQPHISK